MGIRHGKIITLAMCILLGPASFSYATPGNKNDHSKSAGKDKDRDVQVGIEIFIGKDQDAIRHYFHKHSDNLPPGLAKRRGNLPPGLEKQLRRNGRLPPGLDKKISVFPVELERDLPPLKPGLVRGVIEGRAVIFNEKTKVILDIFSIF
jgi:hypothetical protein